MKQFCESLGNHVGYGICVYVVGVSRYSEANCYIEGYIVECLCCRVEGVYVCRCGVHRCTLRLFVLMESVFVLWGMSMHWRPMSI